MIFIGYDYEGYVISIVNARNLELAMAFWQGQDIIPHVIKNLEDDFIKLSEHPTGVYSILKTTEKSGCALRNLGLNTKVILVTKK